MTAMNDVDPDCSTDDSEAPFGTRPRRSPIGLFFFGLLYVVCLVALLWMARGRAIG